MKMLLRLGGVMGIVTLLGWIWGGEPVIASSWFYPMDRYEERITVKRFGDLINEAFYVDKEELFPNVQFFGYHAAVDLEILPGEENLDVPVIAVTEGEIIYVGMARGYGGVILERLPDNRTALYGHVDITAVPLTVGQRVEAGEQIAILGDQFAENSGGERKHLHFGIYRGHDRYFLGHEASEEKLMAKWEDPSVYLRERMDSQTDDTAVTVPIRPKPMDAPIEELEVEVDDVTKRRGWRGYVLGVWDTLINRLIEWRKLLFGKGGE